MIGHRGDRAGLHVRARAEFERNPLVTHHISDLSEFCTGERRRCEVDAVGQGDVVDHPHPVAQSVRAAERDRLVDGRQSECLAGVDGEGCTVGAHVLEGVEMASRRIARLRTCDVESDDALVAIAHREFGDLACTRGVTHRGHQAANRDRSSARSGDRLTLGEAAQHRLDDLVERQPSLEVLLGGITDLGIYDTVGRKVFDAFPGHALERRCRLHHGNGVREGLQVSLQ
ncbi:Uncharacterised protein [Mycobacteroides abscessus subsp. abscessus]|nr:Uncharacterised protein [Mycobacteroides abscessus subsp. abscessus]